MNVGFPNVGHDALLFLRALAGVHQLGLHKVTYILLFRNDPDEVVLHNLLVWFPAGGPVYLYTKNKLIIVAVN